MSTDVLSTRPFRARRAASIPEHVRPRTEICVHRGYPARGLAPEPDIDGDTLKQGQ
jgi:hypothetical protein